jgi:hypothetical protein
MSTIALVAVGLIALWALCRTVTLSLAVMVLTRLALPDLPPPKAKWRRAVLRKTLVKLHAEIAERKPS